MMTVMAFLLSLEALGACGRYWLANVAIAWECYCLAMPACSITAAHLPMSAFMRALNSSGLEAFASMPRLAKRSLMSLRPMISRTVLLSLSTIAADVPLGANKPFQAVTS